MKRFLDTRAGRFLPQVWQRTLSGMLLLLVMLAAFVPATLVRAADDEPAKGKQWALLIGCEKYHRAAPLRFTVNDVRQLAATLRERGGVDEDRILQITDAESNPRFQPLRTSLMSELPKWLSQQGAEDRIIVYFSGHGFRDADGKMYLAPLDCDPDNPAPTGIPVEWFRDQIARCQAGFKLLVIDACHAGSEKGDDEVESLVASKDLGEPFRDLSGVITLASSTADEKSQLWEEKQQSLFTYYLNQGLKGHADANGDSVVDIDELNNFVYRSVTRAAKNHFPRTQTPVRIVRSGVPGVPVVLELKPKTLRQVLSDVADQVAETMRDQGLKRVAVLEFTNDTAVGELLGADFGLLGRYCAEEVAKQLVTLGEGDFAVVDRRRLQRALQEAQFSLADLGSPSALEKLSASVGGMPVLALGTLRNRSGRVINIQMNLMQTETGDLAASAGGIAWLNESEWAMLGRSAQYQKAPPLPGGSLDELDPEEQEQQEITETVEQLDEAADGPHPLLDPNFPYRLRIMVKGQERKPVFRNNEMLVPLRKGETFAIEVTNKSGRLVCMRLLVDGLNTLPEKDTKGVVTEMIAPRVNLDEARHWVLDPQKGERFSIRGFVNETGEGGSLREFLVVDADDSLAARQEFTDQLGMITATFHLPAGASRGRIGIGGGERREEDITERKGIQVGELLAVVHIRYVDADALQAATN